MPDLPRPRQPEAQGGWGHAEARELSAQRGGRPYASKAAKRRMRKARLKNLALALGITVFIVLDALLAVRIWLLVFPG